MKIKLRLNYQKSLNLQLNRLNLSHPSILAPYRDATSSNWKLGMGLRCDVFDSDGRVKKNMRKYLILFKVEKMILIILL